MLLPFQGVGRTILKTQGDALGCAQPLPFQGAIWQYFITV